MLESGNDIGHNSNELVPFWVHSFPLEFWGRKFPWTKVPGDQSSMELPSLWTKVPNEELSSMWTKMQGGEKSMNHAFHLCPLYTVKAIPVRGSVILKITERTCYMQDCPASVALFWIFAGQLKFLKYVNFILHPNPSLDSWACLVDFLYFCCRCYKPSTAFSMTCFNWLLLSDVRADWTSRRVGKAVQWQVRGDSRCSGGSPAYDGVPYIVVGRQILDCVHGKSRKSGSCKSRNTIKQVFCYINSDINSVAYSITVLQ